MVLTSAGKLASSAPKKKKNGQIGSGPSGQLTLPLTEWTADVNRVLFSGHSMGGHGAWHLATHSPDRALGVMSV
jgi:hypothetical protein